MKLRKLLAACACAFVLAGSLTVGASAAQPQEIAPCAVSPANPAEPQADIIETKFRTTKQGILQYRRWNATRGYWVDPEWIDLP